MHIKSVTDKFEASGGNVYCVELVADRAVRIERNKTANRLKNKASKRDIVVSEDRMLREETKYRLVSNDGEIPFENYGKMLYKLETAISLGTEQTVTWGIRSGKWNLWHSRKEAIDGKK